jgi:transposase-like protein
VKTLGVDELSASSVSRISKELDEKLNEFLKRPIEQEIRYLFVDATYAKIREQSRYVTKALFIVVGVRVDGYREILGAKLADSEAESYWTLMFDELKERGLSGVQLVISDGHKGIQAAAASSFVGSSRKICVTFTICGIS